MSAEEDVTFASAVLSCLRRVWPASGRPPALGPTADIRVERRDLCLADLDDPAFHALMEELNGLSDDVGCVVFGRPRDATCVAVIFAGNLERFFMLSAARLLRCPVVYVQDTVSFWYQGSHLLPDLDTFCRTFLLPEIGSSRTILFGQSSGAYAALVASTHLRGATVLACAPQTFSDAGAKSRITFVGIRALTAPDGLVDLRVRLGKAVDPEGLRCVVIAAGELGNPASAHWWGDFIHLLRIINIPGLRSYVVSANSHAVVHGRAAAFGVLLNKLSLSSAKGAEEREYIISSFLRETFIA